jgi:geranylgeranyl pyrophosphate synthase
VLFLAWTLATDPQRAAIRRALGVRDASAADVHSAIKAITATGAIDAVELEIATTAARARSALAGLGLVPPYARILDGIAADVVARDR